MLCWFPLYTTWISYAMLCFVTQSCPTLCDPMDCSPPGSSVHGDSPGKSTRMGCHTLLQGTFPMQGSKLGLPRHRWWILYHLSEPPGKPKNTGMDSLSLHQGIFLAQESALSTHISVPSGASLPPFPHPSPQGHRQAQCWAPCAVPQPSTGYLFYTW